MFGYGSFTGSEIQETIRCDIHLRQLIDRFKDSSSTDSVMRSVSSSSKIHLSVCLFVCLSVCESVCLSVTNAYCHWLKTYFFQTEMSASQNNPAWSTERKYEVVIMNHTGKSGGEHVCPVFQGL